MALSDLSDQLRAAGLFLIRVESMPEQGYDLSFVGSLAEYIQAAKALKSQVVFASTTTISENHFIDYGMDGNDENITTEPIDLCQLVPELKQFKKRIGEDGHIDLSIPLSNGNLTFAVFEDWMVTFTELHAEARQLVSERSETEQAQKQANELAKIQAILEKLRALISDKDFVRLSTQRAMLAYALDKLPELEALEESDLKREIQSLSAKIEAKGIGRK